MKSNAPQVGTQIRAVRKRRLGKGWIVAIVIVAVLLVLWIVSEIVIPAVASSYVKNEIKKKYPQAQDVSVSIRAFPAIRLAFKDYSRLVVKVRDITLEDVKFDSIVLESNKWPNGVFDATVLPSEIMRFFSATHSYVLQPQLAINSGAIQVSGKMNLGYATVSVSATGNLEPRGGKQIFFTPSNIEIAGIGNSAKATGVVRDIMASNPVFVIRADLPFDVTAVTASNGKIQVKGTVDLSKALNIKL
ncbi:MAG: LmeA family phospholipid-binding protein [Candidatus Geothermincolia bacterium]